MMKTSSGKVRKTKSSQKKRRALRGAVVKMLAVMETNPESPRDPVSEFLVTGRTGRRNAMADILGPNANISSGDLPERLQSLCTVDPEAGPSTSNQQQKSTESSSVSSTQPSPETTSTDISKPEGNS